MGKRPGLGKRRGKTIADETFHRWSGEYLTERDWPDAPPARRRILAALGGEPIDNARYLLPFVAISPTEADSASASRSAAESLSTNEQLDIRFRFARSIELRLMPLGRRFSARAVWRSAYALGLRWGDMDVFHWRNPSPEKSQQVRLFSMSAVGNPSYFLPERAEEGETVAGLILSFELPVNPAPVATFDRIAVALDYLRQKLGGRPVAADGGELDYDRLADEREAVREAVDAMTALEIAPASAAALRFF